MLSEEKINKNYLVFQKTMEDNGIDISKMVDDIGEKIKNATFTSNNDSGSAYDGALLQNVKEIAIIAVKNNDMLADAFKVNKQSLIKICFLHQISKCEMFVESKDEWKKKRGINYEFSEYNYALRNGMRSVALCLKYGITFTDEELEGMTIMDRSGDDDQSRFMSSMLSVLIREANFIIMTKNRIENKLNKK